MARSVKRAMAGASSLPVYSYSGPDPGGLDVSDHRSYWQTGTPAVVVSDTSFLATTLPATSRRHSTTVAWPRRSTAWSNAVLWADR